MIEGEWGKKLGNLSTQIQGGTDEETLFPAEQHVAPV